MNNLQLQKLDTKAPALGGKFLRDHKYPFSSRTRLEAFGLFVPPILNQAGRGLPVAATCPILDPSLSVVSLSPDALSSLSCFSKVPTGSLVPGCETLLAWRRRGLAHSSLEPPSPSPSPFHPSRLTHGEGNGTPLQYSCLEILEVSMTWASGLCARRSHVRRGHLAQ